MKNKIETFRNDRFGNVRIILLNEEPWFVGKDVAVILGYTNPQKAVRDHVDHEDRTVNESFTVNGTPVTLINESGLYSLIISSKLPDAKAFKRWITNEVLPLIRKTGGYMTESLLQRIQKDPAVIYEFADALLAEKKKSTALATELALAKPKYFMPVHGEAAHLRAHAKRRSDRGRHSSNAGLPIFPAVRPMRPMCPIGPIRLYFCRRPACASASSPCVSDVSDVVRCSDVRPRASPRSPALGIPLTQACRFFPPSVLCVLCVL